METLYILNPNTFNGYVEATMPKVETSMISTTKVHYSEETFEQYNKRKGGELIVVKWEQLRDNYLAPLVKTMQKDWKETTEENFQDALNCLPPHRWTRGTNSEFFVLGEEYGYGLGCFYVRIEDKYYNALRPMNEPSENVFNLVNL